MHYIVWACQQNKIDYLFETCSGCHHETGKEVEKKKLEKQNRKRVDG